MNLTTTSLVRTPEVSGTVTTLPLLQSSHWKTIDIGRDGNTLSCGPLGDILQLSCYHPFHGIVIACPFAQFDGERFHDPEYVRAYRTKLLDHVRSGTRGFGIQFEGEPLNLRLNFVDGQWILIQYSIQDIEFSTRVSVGIDGKITQSTVINSAESIKLDYTLFLHLSVNRASYGQLTEGGPVPIPALENELRIFDSGHRWAVVNENLNAMVEGSLHLNGKPIVLGRDGFHSVIIGSPIHESLRGTVDILAGEPCTLASTFVLKPGTNPASLRPQPSLFSQSFKGDWKIDDGHMSRIVQRNLEYILGNCRIPVTKEAVCFITDHVALPLGWNRDNYWQIVFLLDVYRDLDSIAHPKTAQYYASQIRDSVRRHLSWVFCLAERPHGFWHRSYLVTGVPKDGPVFQQDQQCYPLLEICDFHEKFPEERAFVERILSDQTIPLILNMLEDHRDATTGLYVTDETPGDDAVEYPFHFSSHVLLWHTIKSLSRLVQSFPTINTIDFHQLNNLAEQIKKATLQYFVSKHFATGETLFAYLTDGAGHYKFYHDANDIPTLFALDWGFVDTAELRTIWSQTMAFGLSSLNEGGFYPTGKFGGLGSVHTRGPWPLGYAQEFVYASLMGNKPAKNDAWRRIRGAMFWDGLFSEAVDCHTGECVSKAWFSWPGSMIGSALLRFGLEPVKSLI